MSPKSDTRQFCESPSGGARQIIGLIDAAYLDGHTEREYGAATFSIQKLNSPPMSCGSARTPAKPVPARSKVRSALLSPCTKGWENPLGQDFIDPNSVGVRCGLLQPIDVSEIGRRGVVVTWALHPCEFRPNHRALALAFAHREGKDCRT